MTKYFLDGDKVLALEGGVIRILHELAQPMPDSTPINVIAHPVPDKPQSKAERIRAFLNEGYNAREIVEKFKEVGERIGTSDVYAQKSKMKRSDGEEAKPVEKANPNTESIRQAIIAGELTPKEIADQFDTTIATVYVMKSKMKKAGELERHEETIPDPPGENEKVSDSAMVHEVRRLWVDEEMGSQEVCAKMKISLSKFNRIILTNKIVRPQR
jgi:transposase